MKLFFCLLFFLSWITVGAQEDHCSIELTALDTRNKSNVEEIYNTTNNICLDPQKDMNERCGCLRDMQQTSNSSVFKNQRDLLARRLALEEAVANIQALRDYRLSRLPNYFQFPKSCLEIAQPGVETSSACGQEQLAKFLAPGEGQLPESITQRLFDQNTLREKVETMQNNPLDFADQSARQSYEVFLRSLLKYVQDTAKGDQAQSQDQLFISMQNAMSKVEFRNAYQDLYPMVFESSTPQEQEQAMVHFDVMMDLFKSPRIDSDFSRYLSESVSNVLASHSKDSEGFDEALDQAVLRDGMEYLGRFNAPGSVYNIIADETQTLDQSCQAALDRIKNLCQEPRRSQLSDVKLQHLFKDPSTVQPQLGLEILKCEGLHSFKMSRSELRNFDDNTMAEIMKNVFRFDRSNETSIALRTDEHGVVITDLLNNVESLEQNKPIFLSRVIEEAFKIPNLSRTEESRLYAASRTLGPRLQEIISAREFQELSDPQSGLDLATSVRRSQSVQSYAFQGPTRPQDIQGEIDGIVTRATSSQVSMPTQTAQAIGTNTRIASRNLNNQKLLNRYANGVNSPSSSMGARRAGFTNPSRSPASLSPLASPSAITEAQNAGLRPFNSTVMNRLGTGNLTAEEREDVSEGVENLRRYTDEKEANFRQLQEDFEKQKTAMSTEEKSEFENLLAQMNVQINQLKMDREILEQKLEAELTRAPATVTKAPVPSPSVAPSASRDFAFDRASPFDSIPSAPAPVASRPSLQAPLSAGGGISTASGVRSAAGDNSNRASSAGLNNTLGLITSSAASSSVVRLASNQDLNRYAQDLKAQLTNGQKQIVEVTKSVDGRDVIEVYEFVMENGEVQYKLVDSRTEEQPETQVAFEDQEQEDETARTNARITRVAQLEALMREKLGL